MSAKDRYLAALGKTCSARRVAGSLRFQKSIALLREVFSEKGRRLSTRLLRRVTLPRKPAKACMWCAEFMD
jgi:hypothetical protein